MAIMVERQGYRTVPVLNAPHKPLCGMKSANATYPANLCPFYGAVAVVWSVLIRSILHKRDADFKRFLGGLSGDLQGPDNPAPCGVLPGKTARTKRRNENLSRDYGRLI
jgi:hypothetical protein